MFGADDATLPPCELLWKFERTIRRRNWREYAAAAFVALSFGAMALTSRGALRQLSAATMVIGARYVAWRLERDGSLRIAAGERESEDAARGALVREMRRQADLLHAAPIGYVAPLGAGWAGLVVADLLDGGPSRFLALHALCGVALGAVIAFANRHAARKLRERASALDSPIGARGGAA